MSDSVFISYAQTGEDVVLWRSLHPVQNGRYVEVGANHPSDMSITRSFYDRGWSGITVEPVPFFADLHRAERPRDTLVQAAVTSDDVASITLHEIPGTGLSTLMDDVSDRHGTSGWAHTDITVPATRLDALLDAHLDPADAIHFMVIDTEGAERKVIESIDLTVWRPWILVVEATAPLSKTQTHGEWEQLVLDAGYEFCLFDGVSRFYVSSEHAADLKDLLSYPACPHDAFETRSALDARLARGQLVSDVFRWRAAALERWTERAGMRGSTEQTAEIERLRHELEAIHGTLSWRVTAPLRAVRARWRA
ncbi:FkbM family methyltransferase [Pengzhenrongella frigida]|uniref:FkbM family methyltransferase n=1 Tax=Pengzhenrongella frigida TaxID=1259133 RepID=A0A4Q5N031_9MICO|nr:FkbM family methyltransferase [Cellulomonas sp. HLT2-17]RYV51370.1 FkbM family methyltransferase [Cellulomonas sp. HLT2-17]